jgi:hypothetical protein
MTQYIPDTAYGLPACWEGLSYESARDATPQWFGVSSGNGNDGVSHTFADYYVRTCEPYTLAQAAILGMFKPEGYDWALENSGIDGEAEFGISAVIYDPPEDPADRDHSECENGEDCDGCDMCIPEDNSWSAANGAWMIIEVFPVTEDDMRDGRMMYDSLDDALSADVVKLAREAE